MMIRAAALAALLLATAAHGPALGQGQTRPGDVARREIKAQLEGVRAPMYSGGQALPGVTATYSVSGTGCRSQIDVSMPAHRIGTTDQAGRIEQVTLDWNGVSQVVVAENGYVVVHAAGLPDGKRYFYAGSTAGAARLKAAMDTLAGACFGAAAHTAPVNVPPVAERVPEKPDILGTPQCRFRQIPELLLRDSKPPVVKTAVYRVPAREGGGKDTRFAFGAQSGDQIANWEGILADPQIVLQSDAHLERQVTRAVLTVDGRPLQLPVAPYHPENKYKGTGIIDGNYSKTVSVNPTRYAPGELLAEIARGTTLQVRLYAGSRAVSSWTFDVHTLRLAPTALKAARWTCK